jgi:hypothetical protein
MKKEDNRDKNFLTARVPFSPCPFIKDKENQKLRMSLSVGSNDPFDLQSPSDIAILNQKIQSLKNSLKQE